jgi:hypothetical protein
MQKSRLRLVRLLRKLSILPQSHDSMANIRAPSHLTIASAFGQI